MTEELRMLDSEFDEIFTVIKKGMDRLEKEKGDAKMKKWVELDGKLKQCNDLLKSYRLEIYELEKSDRVLFDKNAERYEQTISKLQSDLMFRRPKSDREELFQGVQQGGRDIETMTADEILDEAGKVQDTDLKIIRDASNLLTTETVPIAERTLGLLQEQTQDLERIAVDLSTVPAWGFLLFFVSDPFCLGT
eukprot:TRINITY_DN2930_c0_g1_i1.p1 TRINITY_DN2930_c0_g1~~TRINITY_DN2930_c0_g1_i1.p1  ORF type:complete len:205 (+),score=29.72 TRINITY_DN2930_c0_g1_i1:41-616(+)